MLRRHACAHPAPSAARAATRAWIPAAFASQREVTEASKGLQDSITKQMSALNRDMEHLKMVLHAIAKNDKIVLTEDSEAPADGARSIETDDV